MTTYFAILTAVGEAKLANAQALGTTVQISQMAVGDGNGNTPVPVRTQTALVAEKRRAALNSLSVDPQNASAIIAEQVIPENVGGWWIRELGLYDTDGSLIAVANCPPTYKPQLAEGSGRTQVIRMVLIVSSTAAVQLQINPAVVLATRAYVDASVLTVADALVAHAAQNDNPHGTTKAQVGLGSVENYPTASQAEAEAGTAANRYMTPQRTAQSIRRNAPQIRSVAASVAANALTLTLDPASLDFRSTDLTVGAVNTRSNAAAVSLVVPSGATLGTVSGKADRLALLAIDNAGTIELAVANLAGGLNLDETTLISTTAISGAANSASTIYSAAARANVPFRVVGFIDITQAVAGTWASAPTRVQGQGGQALSVMQSLGYGQTWQLLTGSRAFNTVYYNTTGRPIAMEVMVTTNTATTAGINLIIDDINFGGEYTSMGTAGAKGSSVFGIVPPGKSYQVSVTSGSPSLSYWNELR